MTSHNLLKKCLISVAALALIAPLANGQSTPAFARRHSSRTTRVRRHVTARHHQSKKARRSANKHHNRKPRKASAKVSASNNEQGNDMSSITGYVNSQATPVANLNGFNRQIRNRSLKDINRDRRAHHKRALKTDYKLNKIANVRAKQAYIHFSHFEGHHNSLSYTYFKKDAKRYGINAKDVSWGENIARNDFSNDPTTIADQMNDGYMNDDANSHWSHRHNILNRNWSCVGIGSYHDNNTNETYQVEEFMHK